MGMLHLLLRLHLSLVVPHGDRRDRDDRGDVPGWVLVTIMTVGLVAGITAVAGPQLNSMLQSALSSVK